ncbi:MAG TPA: hypothetical protein GXX36_16640 [Clostridiaceae bacterium]|nr:hypothetical protein [Clostridiaceae bacterium]
MKTVRTFKRNLKITRIHPRINMQFGINIQSGINITGAIDADNLNLRIDGFKEAIKDYPETEIVAIEPSNSDAL